MQTTYGKYSYLTLAELERRCATGPDDARLAQEVVRRAKCGELLSSDEAEEWAEEVREERSGHIDDLYCEVKDLTELAEDRACRIYDLQAEIERMAKEYDAEIAELRAKLLGGADE